MGLWPMDHPYTAHCTFNGHFTLAILLGMIQTGSPSLWILVLGFVNILSYRIYRPLHNATGADMTLARPFVLFMDGLLGREGGTHWAEFLWKMLFQFLGSFVGAILFNVISADTTVLGLTGSISYKMSPQPTMTAFMGASDTTALFFFIMSNMVTVYFLAQMKGAHKANDFYGGFVVATAYMFTWMTCQYSFTNAIGGFSVDVARMVAAVITDSDPAGVNVGQQKSDRFGKVWIIIVGTFAGWAIGYGTVLMDEKVKAMEAGKATSDAAPKEDEEAVN